MNKNVILGTKLRDFRKKQNLTQQQLAEILNVAVSVIGGAESGKRGISKNLAIKLSDFFNTTESFWINPDAEKDYIENRERFELLDDVLVKLIEKELLTSSKLDEATPRVKDLVLKSLELEIDILLKKRKKDV